MSDCKAYQELISRMLDEDLSEAEKARLHAHIEDCPECRRMLDAFSMLQHTMADDLEEPPAELAKAVMEQVRREPVSIAKKRGKHVGRWLALAACLAIVVFSAYRFELFGRGKSAPADASIAGGAELFMQESKTASSAPADAPAAAALDSLTAQASHEKLAETAAEAEPEDSGNGTDEVCAPSATSAPDQRDAVKADAPQSLDYEGECWQLAGYVEKLPEISYSVPAASSTQADTNAESFEEEAVSKTLIDGRLYLQLGEELWAVYEK